MGVEGGRRIYGNSIDSPALSLDRMNIVAFESVDRGKLAALHVHSPQTSERASVSSADNNTITAPSPW